MDECEKAFAKLKEYLSKPLLLFKPINLEDLYLCLPVFDREQKPILQIKNSSQTRDKVLENGKTHLSISNSSKDTLAIFLAIRSSSSRVTKWVSNWGNMR